MLKLSLVGILWAVPFFSAHGAPDFLPQKQAAYKEMSDLFRAQAARFKTDSNEDLLGVRRMMLTPKQTSELLTKTMGVALQNGLLSFADKVLPELKLLTPAQLAATLPAQIVFTDKRGRLVSYTDSHSGLRRVTFFLHPDDHPVELLLSIVHEFAMARDQHVVDTKGSDLSHLEHHLKIFRAFRLEEALLSELSKVAGDLPANKSEWFTLLSQFREKPTQENCVAAAAALEERLVAIKEIDFEYKNLVLAYLQRLEKKQGRNARDSDACLRSAVIKLGNPVPGIAGSGPRPDLRGS